MISLFCTDSTRLDAAYNTIMKMNDTKADTVVKNTEGVIVGVKVDAPTATTLDLELLSYRHPEVTFLHNTKLYPNESSVYMTITRLYQDGTFVKDSLLPNHLETTVKYQSLFPDVPANKMFDKMCSNKKAIDDELAFIEKHKKSLLAKQAECEKDLQSVCPHTDCSHMKFYDGHRTENRYSCNTCKYQVDRKLYLSSLKLDK